MDTLRHKIAHVITNSESFGGAQRNTLLTLQGLSRDGYEVELVCGSGRRLIEKARAIGISVHVVPDLIREVRPLKDGRVLLHLYRLFRSRGYRIVHTHSAKAGFLGRLAAWWAGVPVIIHTCHGVPIEIGKNLRSRFYFAGEKVVGIVTNRLVCVGEALRQEILAWKIVPDKKSITIYSGIDFFSYIPKRTPSEVKRTLGLEEGWPIVGSIGRLSEQKAQHYLVEAVARLKDKCPQIRLLLVGEGKLRPLLEKQIEDFGLSSNVILMGERTDIPDILNLLDVYAMSSRWEGIGRALTEAMYFGLPIVATSVNGVKEVILHEETGLIVPPQNPGALADAIDHLVTDPVLAKRVGSNAKRKAEELMGGEKMIMELERLYSEV